MYVKSNNTIDINQNFRVEGLQRLMGAEMPDQISLSPLLSQAACLFIEENPFSHVEPRMLFVPPAGTQAGFSPESYQEIYNRFNAARATLFLAQSVAALERGAIPGEQTLFAPHFPSLHSKAIASSYAVVSFHLEPILVAIANRVPGVFLCQRPGEESKMAEQFGVPVVSSFHLKDLVERTNAILSSYPWSQISHCCVPLKAKLVERLRSSPSTKGFGTAALKKPFSLVSTLSALNVCTISDTNYLPFALGFIENLLEVAGAETRFHILALDKEVEPAIRRHFPELKARFIYLEDLWIPEELKIIKQRSIGFQAFSSKPQLLAKVLRETGRAIFHFDSDVYFFGRPEELFKEIEGAKALLFPHWNDQFPEARLDGLYNAGMIGVAPGAENFLRWWSEACLKECSFDRKKGAVGDQGYLDFAPVLFEGIKIYRGKDHDVARWNLKTLGVHWDFEKAEHPLLGDGRSVQSYHAAFVDELGVFEKKFCWDQLVSFFSPAYVLGSSQALRATALKQQRVYWTTLVHIQKLNRWWGRIRFSKRENDFEENYSLFFFKKSGRRLLKWAVRINRGFNSGFRPFRFRRVPKQNSTTSWVSQTQKTFNKEVKSEAMGKKAA